MAEFVCSSPRAVDPVPKSDKIAGDPAFGIRPIIHRRKKSQCVPECACPQPYHISASALSWSHAARHNVCHLLLNPGY